jgi:hypothetical protein
LPDDSTAAGNDGGPDRPVGPLGRLRAGAYHAGIVARLPNIIYLLADDGVHRGMGTGPVPGAPGQLYRMGGDPGEVHNLLRSHPRVVRELHDELERIRAAAA